MFDLTTPEEELKNKVAVEFFGDFDTTERTNNIDFMVAPKNQPTDRKNYYLWAEAKKGNKSDIYASIVQLILTIGKAKLQDSLIPPHFLGALAKSHIFLAKMILIGALRLATTNQKSSSNFTHS